MSKRINKLLVALLGGLVCVILAIASLFLTEKKVSAAEGETETVPASVTYETSGKQSYQGEHNRYFMYGNYAANSLARMYYQNVYSAAIYDIWTTGSDTNWIQAQDAGISMNPFVGCDTVVVQVLEYGGTLTFTGAVDNGIVAAVDNMQFSIYVKHADGSADTTVWQSAAFTQGSGMQTLPTGEDTPTTTVAAGDAIYYVATNTGGNTAWSWLHPHITATVSGCTVSNTGTAVWTDTGATTPSDNGYTYQDAKALYTNGTVRNMSLVMKTAGGINFCGANTPTDDACGVQDGGGWIGQYFSNTPSGVEIGVAYVAPADGVLNLMGYAQTQHAGMSMTMYKGTSNGTTFTTTSEAIALISGAGAEITSLNANANFQNISLKQGEGILLLFTSNPWETALLNMSADFCATPTVATGYNVSYDTDGGSEIATTGVLTGGATVAPTAPTKAGYTFEKWTLNEVDYTFGTVHTENITLKAVWTKNTLGATLKSMIVSADSDLTVSFKYEFPDAIKTSETAYVSLTLDDYEAETTKVSEVTADTDGYYWFSIGVAPAELTKNIQVVLYEGDDFGVVYEYSAKDYLDHVIANEDGTATTEEIDLAKALLNYGAYAQVRFDVNAANLANAGLYAEGANPVETLDDTAITSINTKTGECTGITFTNFDFVMNDTMVLRLFFTLDDVMASANYTFELSYNDGTSDRKFKMTAAETGTEGEYYIDIPHIAAALLDREYTVTVVNTVDNSEGAITTSALAYANAVVGSEDTTTAQKNLVKALYLYNQAANAKFGV